jgi:hypothetical protein
MLDEYPNCCGTGECPVCFADDGECSWCDDGACADCNGSGLGPFICEEV